MSIETARATLDRFGVGPRLQHIREFVWRGGILQARAERSRGTQALDVSYALIAQWPAAVLDADQRASNGLVQWTRPVVEGRWARGQHGYELRIGIDYAVPSAMYIRSRWFQSHVPFLNRPVAQVEEALSAELTHYVSVFTSHFAPVPEAAESEAQRLRELGLAA